MRLRERHKSVVDLALQRAMGIRRPIRKVDRSFFVAQADLLPETEDAADSLSDSDSDDGMVPNMNRRRPSPPTTASDDFVSLLQDGGDDSPTYDPDDSDSESDDSVLSETPPSDPGSDDDDDSWLPSNDDFDPVEDLDLLRD